MTTKTVVFTPQAVGQAVELSAGSGLWKKQILPNRKVKYKGRVLDFNRSYFTELTRSFKRRAFDQNPIQIADASNKHNNDPRNFGGELVDLAVEDDGLYGVFKPSGDGAQVLEKNPKIGVSARILEGYTRSDGATFPKALQHVLLTVDPHIPGMKPWEKVAELSADEQPETIIDLSSDFEEEEMPTRKQTTKVAATEGEGDEVTLSREEYEGLQQLLADHQAALEFASELEESVEGEDEGDEEFSEENVSDQEGDPALPEQVRLTMEAQSAQILELTSTLRGREVEHEIERLHREGLAPAVIEAARPLLALPEAAIELSNGESVDVPGAVRGLIGTLVELARNGEAFVQYDVELGRTESDPESERRESLLKAWDEAVGE